MDTRIWIQLSGILDHDLIFPLIVSCLHYLPNNLWISHLWTFKKTFSVKLGNFNDNFLYVSCYQMLHFIGHLQNNKYEWKYLQCPVVRWCFLGVRMNWLFVKQNFVELVKTIVIKMLFTFMHIKRSWHQMISLLFMNIARYFSCIWKFQFLTFITTQSTPFSILYSWKLVHYL